MNAFDYDVVIIGGGCAGMAAACAAKANGAERILIIERNAKPGGVLCQCIHNGFGIHRFGEDLTGVEYAAKFIQMIQDARIDIWTDAIVLHITREKTITVSSRNGLKKLSAGAIVLATGCRERSRGALSIPGTRPAGVMTAGTAQRYLNLEGYLVGKRIVILGSGDIGLIMARQFVLAGASVLAVAEIQPFSSGLARNIVQCIEDFGILLYYNTTVSRIEGQKRLRGVWLSQVDSSRYPIAGTERFLECDSLILSVGLIPENELLWQAGISIDPSTGGAVVDDYMQTEAPGIFACGNALHVHDLVDFVTLESETAGKNAALWTQERLMEGPLLPVQAGFGVSGLVPQKVHAAQSRLRLQFRPAARFTDCFTTVYSGGRLIYRKKRRVLTPGEMCEISLDSCLLKDNVKVQVET